MSAIANYTTPELTSEQHEILVTALTVAESHYRNQIKEDPAFVELTETEDTDPEALLDQLIANPALLPDETLERSDTSEISELLWRIKHFGDLRKLLIELEPHCAGCGKITGDIGQLYGHGPSMCDSCLDAVAEEGFEGRAKAKTAPLNPARSPIKSKERAG